MDISSNINNSYWRDSTVNLADQKVSRNFETNDWIGSERELLKQSLFESNISRDKILNQKELATLHMLFGTQKPEEMTVYGKNKMQQIYKGHLIDLVG